jgi:hypothetical protein
MNVEQPCRYYSGVTRHAGKWLAKFRCNGRDVNLGHYERPEDAAWVADFARYLCFGLKPGHWHFNVGKPNAPPRSRPCFPRVLIIVKLLDNRIVSPEVLKQRLAEFDAVGAAR